MDLSAIVEQVETPSECGGECSTERGFDSRMLVRSHHLMYGYHMLCLFVSISQCILVVRFQSRRLNDALVLLYLYNMIYKSHFRLFLMHVVFLKSKKLRIMFASVSPTCTVPLFIRYEADAQ